MWFTFIPCERRSYNNTYKGQMLLFYNCICPTPNMKVFKVVAIGR